MRRRKIDNYLKKKGKKELVVLKIKKNEIIIEYAYNIQYTYNINDKHKILKDHYAISTSTSSPCTSLL